MYLWLEERLKLGELLNKDSVEISGGQKKRVYIYGFNKSM